MKNWLQNDKIVFLLSITIAIIMWWSISYRSFPFVKEEGYSVKIQDVKVQAMYNEGEYELNQKTDRIDLTLIGNKFILDNLPESSYRVFVNLRGLGPGKHRNVPIQVEGLPINVRKEVYPTTVDVELEKKVEKEVPVQVDLIGTPAEGYQVQSSAILKPDKVTVNGTESMLRKVHLVKAGVNINGATESIEKTIKLEVYGENGPISGVIISPQTVNVIVPIERLSKKVPLNIEIEKGPPRGYRVKKIHLNSDAILVYGPKEFLDQLLIYNGNQIDLSKVTSTTTFHLPIKRQNEAIKIEPDQVRVTVEVVPVG